MTTLDLESHQSTTLAMPRLIAQLGIAQNHMQDLLGAETEVPDRIRKAQLQVERILERFAALVDMVGRTYQLRSTTTNSGLESHLADSENLVQRLARLNWGARNLITILLRALGVPPDVHAQHVVLQDDFDQLVKLVEEVDRRYEPQPRPNDIEQSSHHDTVRSNDTSEPPDPDATE